MSRRLGRAEVAALGCGLAYPLGFAPFELWPVSVAALAGLMLCTVEATPRRAAWRGWLFGLASFAVGVSWVRESFQFAAVPAWLSVTLMVGFVALLALYPALFGYLGGRRGVRPDALRLLGVLPAAWLLVEWLRGWLLSGFTWLQAGYAHVDAPLGALLPVGGVYLAGLAAAVTGGALALGARAVVARRPRAVAVATVAVGLVWLSALVAGQMRWAVPNGDPLRVTLVQGNVPQDEKWRPEMRGPTLSRYVTLTEESWPEADLVIWPETAIPGMRSRMAPFIDALGANAHAADSRVLFGVPVRENGAFLNSVELVGLDAGIYHKRHLVPFGEFLPFAAILRPIAEAAGVRVASFTPGPSDQAPLRVAGHPVGVTVCFEIAFGAEVARALPDAAMLVTVSNDAWFGTSIGPHQHFQMARARARETARYLARATNTGISAFVGPAGEVLARSPQFEVHALSQPVQPLGGATPYVRTGDWPVMLFALGAFVAGASRWRRSNE